jgi:hypothetical protein
MLGQVAHTTPHVNHVAQTTCRALFHHNGGKVHQLVFLLRGQATPFTGSQLIARNAAFSPRDLCSGKKPMKHFLRDTGKKKKINRFRNIQVTSLRK